MKKMILSILTIVLLLGIIGNVMSALDESGSGEAEEEIKVIFDAPKLYYEKDEKTLSYTRKMIKKKFGEPKDTDSWVYTNIYGDRYQMHTFYYDKYEMLFCDIHLLRVTLRDIDLETDNKVDIMNKFGLSKYANTEFDDNNITFSAKNTDIYQIKVTDYKEEDAIVQLTYYEFPW